MTRAGVTFRFTGQYPLMAAHDAVLAALVDPQCWPRWWRQIRSVQRHDEHSGTVVVRSRLPMTLHLELTDAAVTADELRADLGGDLIGWVSYRVRGSGPTGCLVSYRQESRLRRSAPRALLLAVAPLLRWNHEAMMRSGMRGLEAYASGRG